MESEGDRATPEGTYRVCVRNEKSQFLLSLVLSYPGPTDAARGPRDPDMRELSRVIPVGTVVEITP